LTVQLFELHDRERFSVHGFCWTREDGSAVRRRIIAAMDQFTRIGELDDDAAAQCIRAQEIDILIDLQGLTSGARPNVLMQRPAPVQISYLGFPGTSGLPTLDYLLADAFLLPEAQRAQYSEQPLLAPYCFQISDCRREQAPPLTRAAVGLPDDAFVFCCFNNNYKITEEVFGAWMRILQQVPGSLLWLLADNPSVPLNLRREAQQRGIDPQRLVFAERVAPPVYLTRYTLADVFLDTFPFNAGTTANDALWMGLPVVTRSGRAFAARMAGALLHAAGLDELIVDTLAEYEALAVRLAQSPPTLLALKTAVAKLREHGGVFDMPARVRDIEALYLRAYEEKCPLDQPPPAPLFQRGEEIPPAPPFSKGGDKKPPLEHSATPSPPLEKGVGGIDQKDELKPCFLTLGCGLRQNSAPTLPLFQREGWREIRYNCDPTTQPDIVGALTDLQAVAAATVDAVYLHHTLELLYLHETALVLTEARRVLKPDGFLVVICADLQAACAKIAANALTEPLYHTATGVITPFDVVFGHQHAGQPGWAHHCGFTRDSLVAALNRANFGRVGVIARAEYCDLWGFATKQLCSAAEFTALSQRVFNSLQ
jgi:SAM-dependent methyltransferase